MSKQEESLYVRSEKGVFIIEFANQNANALSTNILYRMADAFKQASDDEKSKVILLKSENKTFCAGADLKSLLAISNQSEAEIFFEGFAKVLIAMQHCKKVITGRVQGKAVGGSLGLLSACDYVFACEAAAIKLSELSIGIGPFVIEPALTRKIGLSACSDLTLSPLEWKNAYWAKEKGLYNKVYQTSKELDKELQLYLEKMTTYSTKALCAIKNIFWENTTDWSSLMMRRAKISAELILNDDCNILKSLK